MIAEHIDELEKKVATLIKQTNKRKNKAKKSKVKHYFEGQNDAFEQILIELKTLRYELETSFEEDEEEKKEKEQASEKSNEHLLEEALEKGVITRNVSLYLHDDLPNGKVRGKKRILEALNDNSFSEKIQHQLANI